MPEELELNYFDTSQSSFDQLRLLKSLFENESWIILQWPDPSAGPSFTMRIQFVGPSSSSATSSPSESYLLRILSGQTISDNTSAAVRTVLASILPHLRDGSVSNLGVTLPEYQRLQFVSRPLSVTLNTGITVPLDASASHIATLELLQNLEYSHDLKVKFAAIDNEGSYVSDALEEEYKSFLTGLPEGWQRDSDDYFISTRRGHTQRAWHLRSNELDVAVVAHETGVEILLLGIAAGVATNAIYDFMKWGWKKWQERRELSPNRAYKAPTFFEIERIRRDSDGTLLGSEVVRIRGPVDDPLLQSTMERMIYSSSQ